MPRPRNAKPDRRRGRRKSNEQHLLPQCNADTEFVHTHYYVRGRIGNPGNVSRYGVRNACTNQAPKSSSRKQLGTGVWLALRSVWQMELLLRFPRFSPFEYLRDAMLEKRQKFRTGRKFGCRIPFE